MARATSSNRSENCETLISDALGRAPDLAIGSGEDGWQLCRWRQFAGAYSLPALPTPVFAAHVVGRSDGKFAQTATCVSIVPPGQVTGWLVDGDIDVVTLSLSCAILIQASAADQFRRMQFAFADPLGAALTLQVFAEIYTPASAERDDYLGSMVTALKAHIGRVPLVSEG